jgi:hypothetical protein
VGQQAGGVHFFDFCFFEICQRKKTDFKERKVKAGFLIFLSVMRVKEERVKERGEPLFVERAVGISKRVLG